MKAILKQENKIQFYIEGENLPIVKNLIDQIFCEHEWHKHEMNFLCEKCGYYSGLDANLNKKITKLLKLKS